MKYLLTALLILSAGTAGAASGNLGADGNTQFPNITVTNTTTMNKAILTGELTSSATGWQLSSITPQTFSNTASGLCWTGSTITFTCAGACYAYMAVSTEWHSATLGNNPYISFLVDGVSVLGASAINSMQEPVANYYASVSVNYFKSFAAGTHNICVTVWTGANSIIVGTGGNSFSGFIVH